MSYGSGIHKGIVHEVGDAGRTNMVRVRIPGLGRDFVTGWAEACLNGINAGGYAKGDGVWVGFEYPANGPDNAVVLGRYLSIPSGFSELPSLGQQPAPGPAPFNRGLRSATTDDLTALGGQEPISFEEPPAATGDEYPNVYTRQTPNGITEEWADTLGARRIHTRLAEVWEEWREDGLVARGGAQLVEFFTRGAFRFIGGPLAQVVAGDAQHTVEGEQQISILGALIAKAQSLRARIGTLSVTVDGPTASSDTSGGEPVQVRGAELFARGALRLLSIGDLLMRGKRAMLAGVESAMVTAAGDVTVDAVGSLDSWLIAIALAAAGIAPGTGKATVQGKTVVLSTRPTGLAGVVPPTTKVTIDDDAVTVIGINPLDTPESVFLISAADLTALLSHTHPTTTSGVPTGPSVELAAVASASASSKLKAVP